MDDYPVRFAVDYPDRQLNRLTTAFRIFTVIPIAIVLGAIGGYSARYDGGSNAAGGAARRPSNPSRSARRSLSNWRRPNE